MLAPARAPFGFARAVVAGWWLGVPAHECTATAGEGAPLVLAAAFCQNVRQRAGGCVDVKARPCHSTVPQHRTIAHTIGTYQRFDTWTTPVPTLPSPPPKKSRKRFGPMGVAEHRKITLRRSPWYLHPFFGGVFPLLPARGVCKGGGHCQRRAAALEWVTRHHQWPMVWYMKNTPAWVACQAPQDQRSTVFLTEAPSLTQHRKVSP